MGRKGPGTGPVMASTSSPLVQKTRGPPSFQWLAMASVLLLLSLASPKSSSAVELPDMVNGVEEGDEFYCFRDYIRCMSGIKQCIRPTQECNGVKDCDDGSDEGDRCQSFNCSSIYRHHCPSGQMCMSGNSSSSLSRAYLRFFKDPYILYLCDGVKDCADGSDEDPSFCASYDCNSEVAGKPLHPVVHRERCPGGKGGCLEEEKLCDGVVDCVGDGGSDESDEFCKKRGCSPARLSSLFQCSSGRCIHNQKSMCDGKRDCPDGEDEDEQFCNTFSCPYESVKCRGGGGGGGGGESCVEVTRLCDGVEDCPGGTDEQDCANRSCGYSHFKCPSGWGCARYTNCDGVKECKDGSDEDPSFCRSQNCSGTDQFRCKDGATCIALRSVCDGVKDCPDKSDEDPVYCREQHNCSSSYQYPHYMSQCPGSRYVWCVLKTDLCNGCSNHCYEGADEDPEFCASSRVRDLIDGVGRISCLSDSTKYIYAKYCDGKKNCEDGSDERPEFCKTYTCSPSQVKCYGKWCVEGGRCDGKPDCPDGSDEEGCGGGGGDRMQRLVYERA